MPKNLHILPKVKDSLSYVYIEYARIAKDEESVCFIQKDEYMRLPVASLSVVLLGPGTSITHEAVKILNENRCSIIWCGQDATRFYSQGSGNTRSSVRLLKQSLAWSNPESRLFVARKMYELRFNDKIPKSKNIKQIRGMEGARVRDIYAKLSKETGVKWNGRNYDYRNWNKGDVINRAISSANSYLYGIIHSAIVALGYSPAIGFVHSGKMLSFVYDVADIYKMETTVPIAFHSTAECENPSKISYIVRQKARKIFSEQKLMSKIAPDLEKIFDLPQDILNAPFDLNEAVPIWVIDDNGYYSGGRNYGDYNR